MAINYSDAVIARPTPLPGDAPAYLPPGDIDYSEKVIIFIDHGEDYANAMEDASHIDDATILQTLNRFVKSPIIQNLDGDGDYKLVNMKDGISDNDYVTLAQFNLTHGSGVAIDDTNFNSSYFIEVGTEFIIDDTDWADNSVVGVFSPIPFITLGLRDGVYAPSNYGDKNSFNKTYKIVTGIIIDLEHPTYSWIDTPIIGDRVRLVFTDPTTSTGFKASTTGINGQVAADTIVFDRTYRIAITELVFTSHGWFIKNLILGDN